jgi:hypothetical protein
MKINLKLPNGAELEFEGDAAEFERLQGFLAEPPDALNTPTSRTAVSGSEEGPVDDSGGGASGASTAVTPEVVAERIEKVGAKTDIERLTVIAQLAVEAGMPGADYPLAERLYTDLGFRKPARFTKAVSNAKARNLVRMVSQGVWKPTYIGENYARGHGRRDVQTRRVIVKQGGASRPQLSLTSGGDDDA